MYYEITTEIVKLHRSTPCILIKTSEQSYINNYLLYSCNFPFDRPILGFTDIYCKSIAYCTSNIKKQIQVTFILEDNSTIEFLKNQLAQLAATIMTTYGVSGAIPDSLVAHGVAKEYLITGITPHDFVNIHSGLNFDVELSIKELRKEFKKHCPDYMESLTLQKRSKN